MDISRQEVLRSHQTGVQNSLSQLAPSVGKLSPEGPSPWQISAEKIAYTILLKLLINYKYESFVHAFITSYRDTWPKKQTSCYPNFMPCLVSCNLCNRQSPHILIMNGHPD